MQVLDAEGPTPWQGHTKWIFPICPWNAEHTNSSAFIVQFANGAISAGCHHNGCAHQDWHSLRDRVEPGWRGCTAVPLAQHDDQSTGSCETPWDPLIPFDDYRVPPFPTEVLPPSMRDYVEAVAVATQTPPDLAGKLALTTCAAACAKTNEVSIREGWWEPLNLYTVTVLPPGTRKSAVFAEITRPLRQVEAELAQSMRDKIADVLSMRKILEERLRHTELSAARATAPEERRDLEAEAKQLARKLSTMVVPAYPRLLADDVSTEKLASLLAEQHGRIAIMSPEGDVFDVMAGRYSSSGQPNLGVYLKGHAGDNLRVDRVNRPPESIERPALTIGLAVQSDVLRGLIEKPGFRGRGLLGRFLYALPPNPLGRRQCEVPPVPQLVRTTYQLRVAALGRMGPAHTADGAPMPHVVRVSSEAADLLRALEHWIEPQLAEFGMLSRMSDWASKLAGVVARLAAIMHLFQYAAEAEPWIRDISTETMRSALKLGHYLVAHAKAAYGEMGTDPVVEDARALLRAIDRRGWSELTRRELFEATKGRFKKVPSMEPGLKLLVEHGDLRLNSTTSTNTPGRPPSPGYAVNPLTASHNSQNSDTTLADLTARHRASADEPFPDGLSVADDDGSEVSEM